MEEQQVINQMKLLLGDIIEISAPTNMNLNENTYYIDYIDEEQINLINVSTMTKTNLYMKDGFLTDESVRQISILSRGTVGVCPTKWLGYAQMDRNPIR